jgi:hypothetical protein
MSEDMNLPQQDFNSCCDLKSRITLTIYVYFNLSFNVEHIEILPITLHVSQNMEVIDGIGQEATLSAPKSLYPEHGFFPQ